MQNISITQLRESIGDTMNRVHYGKQPLIVTKRDRPFVVILPITDADGNLTKNIDLRELVESVEENEEDSA